MLHTLGFRIPRDAVDELLGSVVTYPLTEDFVHQWQLLPKASHDGRSFAGPRYAALATALVAVGSRPVKLLHGPRSVPPDEYGAGTRALLTTTSPFAPDMLSTAVRAWEAAARGGEDRNALAPLLPPPGPPRPLSSSITYRPRCTPQAHGWVFDTVAWHLMTRLAAAPLHIDHPHRPLALRPDTDGSLLAWDDTLAAMRAINDEPRAFGSMLRVSVRLATMPGITDPIAVFDAQLSRLTDRWNKVRHAWLRRNDTDPLLRIGVRAVKIDEEWHERPRDYTVDVVSACGLDPLDLPQRVVPPSGDVRAQIPTTRFHPIGKGPGARLLRHLHDHITATLPQLQPLVAHRTPSRVFAPHVAGPPTPQHLRSAVAATHSRRLRIVCLYATSAARHRMLAQLDPLAGAAHIGHQDDTTYRLTDTTTVVFRHRPELLAHDHRREPGEQSATSLPIDRDRLLHEKPVPELQPDLDAITTAWIETEWPSTTTLDRRHDAKPALRRLLGRHGVPTQFLATAPADLPTRQQPKPATREHAARMGLRDLLRGAGIVDHRLAGAAAPTAMPAPLDSPTTLIGIHARLQQQDHRPPALVLCLTAVHADPDATTGWRVDFFHDGRWLPYGEGTARFHASPIGDSTRGRTEDKAANTRRYVEQALAQLTPRLSARPAIVFVDAQESRTIWPGLQNDRFNDGELPGDTLTATDGSCTAVVRCNDNAEIPRPTHRTGEGRLPRDPLHPATPERRLYQFPDSDAAAWYLPRTSVTYRSKGGDLGARHTRWTLPDNLAHLIKDDWHSHRATEIAVVRTGGSPHGEQREPLDVAVLTARLCEQAIAWDHRTRHPGPLHLAVNADLDHPDYRDPTANSEQPVEQNPEDSP